MKSFRRLLALAVAMTTLFGMSIVSFAEVNPASASIPVTLEISEYYEVAAPATVTMRRDDDGKLGEVGKYYGDVYLYVNGALASTHNGVRCSVTLPEMVNQTTSTIKNQLYCLSAHDTAANKAEAIPQLFTGANLTAVKTFVSHGSMPGISGIDVKDLLSDGAASMVERSSFTTDIAKASITAENYDFTGTTMEEYALTHNYADIPAYLLAWDMPTDAGALGTYKGNIAVSFSTY